MTDKANFLQAFPLERTEEQVHLWTLSTTCSRVSLQTGNSSYRRMLDKVHQNADAVHVHHQEHPKENDDDVCLVCIKYLQSIQVLGRN